MQTNTSTYSRLRAGALGGRAVSRPPPAFTPSSLSGYVTEVTVALARAAGRTWQERDGSRLTLAVDDGDPVGEMVDEAGFSWKAPSDPARPLLWDLGGGAWGAFHDGIDDELEAAAPAWVGTAGTLAARFAFAEAGPVLVVLTTHALGSDNEYYNFSGSTYVRILRASRLAAYAALPVDTAPHTQVWVSGADYQLFVDGTQRGATAAADWAAPTTLRVGRCDTNTFFSGVWTSIALTAAAADAAARAALEAYQAATYP